MIEDVIEDIEFSELMQRNIQDLIVHFFNKEQNFGVLCNIEHAMFEPELPKKISDSFNPLTLFFLAGYTFETARIEDNALIFEAGFGADDVGSLVTIPLLAIMQIISNDTPLLINLATYDPNRENLDLKNEDVGVQNSMNSFLSNPENSKFLNK